MTKKTVEGHRGDVVCKSTINKGTTMIITLPVDRRGDDIIE